MFLTGTFPRLLQVRPLRSAGPGQLGVHLPVRYLKEAAPALRGIQSRSQHRQFEDTEGDYHVSRPARKPQMSLLNFAPADLRPRLLFTLGLSFYAVRSFMLIFYNAEFGRYPEPVATSLRRAIYYTNYKPDPELALRFYKKAMQQCAELGLNPFSDEVLGIRIQVAFWLEQIGNYKAAVEVLNSVLEDCKKWISVMEQSVADGKVNDKGYYSSQASNAPPQGDAPPLGNKQGSVNEEGTTAGEETLWRKRQRLLAKSVGTSVKLGELYSNEHVLEPDNAHAHLIWAVESSLREFRRRNSEGSKPGEEAWLKPDEIGGSMESLAQSYERRSQFQLAIPLFFQALRLCEVPCHRAVIMNNLSAAFAQHPIFSPTNTDASFQGMTELLDPAMPQTRRDCLDAALNWAQNAYTHASDVKGNDRTSECDEACAVALCNWGHVAAMQGKSGLARQKYQQCLEISRTKDFAQGLKQAQEGLKRLTLTTREEA